MATEWRDLLLKDSLIKKKKKCLNCLRFALASWPHGHLQQHHLPVLGGMRLVDVSRESRGTEESGGAVFAREDLLLLLLLAALPAAALLSVRVENVRSASSSASQRLCD